MPRSHILAVFSIASIVVTAAPLERYALVLSDAPVAAMAPSRTAIKSSAALARRAGIQKAQGSVRSALAAHEIVVTGSIDTLGNAVFVSARPDQLAELKALPGVAGVVPMVKLKYKLNKAIDLVNARAAWTSLGGSDKAGAGVKIAILDTGIDETHPGFVDATLSMPQGFPKFNGDDDRKHTTNKVIVARSYADILAIGGGTPEGSLPDDYSARDRVGHGTAAAMAAAGVSHTSPVGTISGVAPKAWVGNYKIFGSPGVNDYTNSGVVMQAIEAAYLDGMDVALISAGYLPAEWLPNDVAPTCPFLATGTPCDLWIAALTNAINGGLTIVVPAGNDGEFGLNTIETPGTLPSLITVGASTNVQDLHQTVVTSTPDYIGMRFSNGPLLQAPLTRPLVDVTALDSTAMACKALPANSLSGNIALIQRGSCSFATKAINAAAAGGVAALFWGGDSLFSATGLANSSIPSAVITTDSGTFLKNYLSAHPGGTVTLDPSTAAVAISSPEASALYSSAGPNLADAGIKPELAAPGTLYTAAQNYDPNGSLYSANRYTLAEGTSFAAALVTGAVALVKQAHPNYTAAQLKSAVTNTASAGLVDYDSTGASFPARVIAVGAGKLNVGAAVQSNVTVEPATVGFGAVNGNRSKTIKFTNTSTSSQSLTLSVSQRDTDTKAAVTVNPPSLSLSAGQSAFVTVALTGTPTAGFYEGIINVTGGAVPLRIPYLYLVSTGTIGNLVPLLGTEFIAERGNAVNIEFKITDGVGLPLQGVPVGFAPPTGGSVDTASRSTDSLGIAFGRVFTATVLGEQAILGGVPNVGTYEFDGRTRQIPNINSGGVVDAASFQVPAGFSPGSYLTIFGTGLSETTMIANTPYLPVSLSGVSVSFDSPSTSVHAPAHLYFASSGQISVQIPWELAGTTSAVMKVTLSNTSSYFARSDNPNLGTNQSQTVTIPITQFSPGFFESNSNAAALDENFGVVTASNPVQRGHVLQLFVNGLGPVAPGTQPASGDAAPSVAPLATTTTNPRVTIGGQDAPVQFSGLAPGLVGLYQVNVVVPQGIGTGAQPVTLSIGAVTAKTTNIQVK